MREANGIRVFYFNAGNRPATIAEVRMTGYSMRSIAAVRMNGDLL